MRVGRGSSLWLAKSNGRVLGPYTDRQIGDLLLERVLVPLDEICPSFGRWEYIRDIPYYAKIIEDLRIRNLRASADDTTTVGDQEFSDARTATVSAVMPDDSTQEISSVQAFMVQDIAFNSTEDSPTVNTNAKLNMNAYTHSNDFIVRKKSNETARWLWVVTVVVITLSLSVIIFRKQVVQPIRNKSAYEENIATAMDALESGEYQVALDNFKKAYAIDPKDKSIYLYLGILQIQIENQSLSGRNLLEKLVEDGGFELKRVYTGIGLSYLKENDLTSAELQFAKALEVDDSFRPAIINIGAAAIMGDHLDKAEKYLLRAIREDGPDGAEVLMLVELHMNAFRASKELSHLEAALRFLHEYRKQSTVYRIEMAIADAYISVLRGDNSKAYKDIDKILDMDFIESGSHRMNLFVFRDLISWSKVSQWCLRQTENLEPNSHVVAFEGICLLMAGDIPSATRKIDDALAQTPKDPLVLSAYGMLLQNVNAMDRMSVVIDKAIENDSQAKYRQPMRLKAWLCQTNGDFECAQKYWGQLLNLNPDSLSALAGVTQSELHNKNVKAAKELLVRGLNISNSYRPLFKLNKSISQSEDRKKAKGL